MVANAADVLITNVITFEIQNMAIKSAIRNLSTGHDEKYLLTALFENTVHVWDLDSGKKISEFNTILDSGGDRFAFSEQLGFCVTGAYYKDGVACYSVPDGKMQWQRKDLKKVQSIRISPDGRRVFCCFDEGPCQVLNYKDGSTLEKLRGVRDVEFDPYNSYLLMDKSNPEIFTVNGEKQCTLPRDGFAILDIAFSPSVVAISESANNVRFFDIPNPKNSLTYIPPKSYHVLNLTYNDEAEDFFGVLWDYETGTKKTLIKFNVPELNVIEIADLTDSWEEVFVKSGRKLVTSSGKIINTKNGNVDMILNFPMCDYLDD